MGFFAQGFFATGFLAALGADSWRKGFLRRDFSHARIFGAWVAATGILRRTDFLRTRVGLAQGFFAHGFLAAHGFFAHGLDAQGFFAHGFAAWAGRAAQSEAMRSAANRMNHDFLSIILPPWRDNCDTNFRRPLFLEFWVLIEPMDCRIHERFALGKMSDCRP